MFWKKTVICNCNNISLYYCFYLISDWIKAGLVSKTSFKNIKEMSYRPLVNNLFVIDCQIKCNAIVAYMKNVSTLCTCSLIMKNESRKRYLHTVHNTHCVLQKYEVLWKFHQIFWGDKLFFLHCSTSTPLFIQRVCQTSITRQTGAGDTDFSCPWAQTHSQSHSVNNLNESVVIC